MPMYEAGFNYKVEEFGVVTLEADNEEQADEFTREHVREAYDDATNIEVEYIKELKI